MADLIQVPGIGALSINPRNDELQPETDDKSAGNIQRQSEDKHPRQGGSLHFTESKGVAWRGDGGHECTGGCR